MKLLYYRIIQNRRSTSCIIYNLSNYTRYLSNFGTPMDPHTFSEGNWTLQAYINSLQSPSQKVCGSIGYHRHIMNCPFVKAQTAPLHRIDPCLQERDQKQKPHDEVHPLASKPREGTWEGLGEVFGTHFGTMLEHPQYFYKGIDMDSLHRCARSSRCFLVHFWDECDRILNPLLPFL